MKKQNAFTLTELLIAVAIVGILAAIAVPRYLNQEAARAGEAVTQLSAISMGEKNYRITTGSYIDIIDSAGSPCTMGDSGSVCWDDISTDSPDSAQGFFNYGVSNTTASQFCAVATRNTFPAPSDFSGKTICLNERGEFSGSHSSGPNPSDGTNGCAGICTAT